MRPGDYTLAEYLRMKLTHFDSNVRELPGISNPLYRDCLIEQMIDSVKRIKYVWTISNRNISEICTDTLNAAFDPLKAAICFKNKGKIDEAFWMAFLATHFGKHNGTGWGLVRGIYGGLDSTVWTWEKICQETSEFREWLDANNSQLKDMGAFSNHRKYQSLGAYNPTGTGSTIASYIDWIGPQHDHISTFNNICEGLDSRTPKNIFKALYNSMNAVVGFGRMGRFDYLTMIGKLGLYDVEPDSAYLAGATGPVPGTKLLFFGNRNQQVRTGILDAYLNELNDHLDVYFGMQVLEDAICNWQKNPGNYRHFRG